MAKSKQVRRSRKPAPKRKTRPLLNSMRAGLRFSARVPWIALLLCAGAFLALAVVEASVAHVIHKMASDPISGVIFVASALLASAGVIFGPMVARSIRSPGQRKLAWKVVVFCFALSVLNLSTTLANAYLQDTAAAVRGAPTFEADQARLSALNSRIDALSMDSSRDAEVLLVNVLAERDLISERLAGANPRPVMVAWENDGWVFWAKAILFHVLVAGFTAAFSLPIANKRRGGRAKAKRAHGAAERDDNVVSYQF